MLQQPPPNDRSGSDGDPGSRPPQSDGPGPLASVGKGVGDQRQRGREDHRRSQPHHSTRHDELLGAGGQSAGKAGQGEHPQAGYEHPFSAEPVAQVPRDKQKGSENEVVRVHHPLELTGGGVKLPAESRESDVHDRGVEIDDEGGQTQGQKDYRAVAHEVDTICGLYRHDRATLSKTFPPRTTCWMASWISFSSNTAATGTNRAPLATMGAASWMIGSTFVA